MHPIGQLSVVKVYYYHYNKCNMQIFMGIENAVSGDVLAEASDITLFFFLCP